MDSDPQRSAESIATDLQTLCCLQISSGTVRKKFHGMCFSNLHITKRNEKCQMRQCEARRPLDSGTVETCSLE